MFEKFLWNSRYVVILAVVASLVSSAILFIIATADIAWVVKKTIMYGLGMGEGAGGYDEFHSAVVGHIIGSVDDFLLATVLLIFTFGLYELFISKIEEAENDPRQSSRILLIKNLDDLKDRLAKVVLMILIVTFFKNVIHLDFHSPLDVLYLGGGILLVALALYFTHKKQPDSE